MSVRDWVLLLALLGLYLTATTTEPRDVRDGREGLITHMGSGYPASYLALPIGPGHDVTVCGPARCLELRSTDAGPARSALLRGVVADVSVQLFTKLCGCPTTDGTFQGSWRVAGPRPTLPATDT